MSSCIAFPLVTLETLKIKFHRREQNHIFVARSTLIVGIFYVSSPESGGFKTSGRKVTIWSLPARVELRIDTAAFFGRVSRLLA